MKAIYNIDQSIF